PRRELTAEKKEERTAEDAVDAEEKRPRSAEPAQDDPPVRDALGSAGVLESSPQRRRKSAPQRTQWTQRRNDRDRRSQRETILQSRTRLGPPASSSASGLDGDGDGDGEKNRVRVRARVRTGTRTGRGRVRERR